MSRVSASAAGVGFGIGGDDQARHRERKVSIDLGSSRSILALGVQSLDLGPWR